MSGIAIAPEFRFLQLNDLHLSSPVSGSAQPSFAGANERGAWLIDALRRDPLVADVDFVLGMGDYVHGGSPERLEADVRHFRELMAPLRREFFPVLGNCDIDGLGNAGVFSAAFELDDLSYSFERGGIRFVMLHNGDSGGSAPGPYDDREGWLRETLEAYADTPKIICCHVPLVPMRDPAVLPESLDTVAWRCRAPAILDLVERHSAAILAVLSGHLHLSGMVCTRAIHHVTVAGTASFPSDYGLYSVYADRIDVELKQLPHHLLNEDTDLHGRPRRERDFTDDAHRTHIEYVMGAYDERRFVIPFKSLPR